VSPKEGETGQGVEVFATYFKDLEPQRIEIPLSELPDGAKDIFTLLEKQQQMTEQQLKKTHDLAKSKNVYLKPAAIRPAQNAPRPVRHGRQSAGSSVPYQESYQLRQEVRADRYRPTSSTQRDRSLSPAHHPRDDRYTERGYRDRISYNDYASDRRQELWSSTYRRNSPDYRPYKPSGSRN